MKAGIREAAICTLAVEATKGVPFGVPIPVGRACEIPDFCTIRMQRNNALQVRRLGLRLPHAKLETTAIYVDAVGAQQQEIAARMWE